MKAFALAFVFALIAAQPASAQYFTSATSCYGYTACTDYYGNHIGTVSCQVYGAQYVQGFGIAASNNCSWFVQPYVGVQCSGYAQVVNAYGQTTFAWQNYTARCPGR